MRVMVQKNGNGRLIARILYRGPIPAPVQPGQPVGVVQIGVARRQSGGRSAAAGCRGGRPGLDDLARVRWRRRRTGDRAGARRRAETLEMIASPTDAPRPRPLHQFRRRRGRRQISPDQAAVGAAADGRISHFGDPRTGRLCPAPRSSAICCCRALAA
ncbi:MAG: hypothetical protein MZV49_26245 [Rhodopseudomonas palustris]|nr:hypothetical protein [Rhodopseudomonas palustris]